MTDFAPTISVLKNGSAFTVLGTTGYIDYDFTVSGGRDGSWGQYRPSTATMTYSATGTGQPAAVVGDEIAIQVTVGATTATLFTGYVDTVSISYLARSPVGQVVQHVLTLTSAISPLYNQTYYLAADYTANAKDAIDYIMGQVGTTTWDEVNASTAWQDVIPATVTWATYDTNNVTLLNGYTNNITAGVYSVTIPAGNRNAMADIQTVLDSCHGYVFEDGTGKLFFDDGTSDVMIAPGSAYNTDVVSTASRNDIRNAIIVSNNAGVGTVFSDNNSRQIYGEASGTLDTLLTNSLDVANIGAQIIKSLAYPIQSLRSVSVDLNNPDLSDAARIDMLTKSHTGATLPLNTPGNEFSNAVPSYTINGVTWSINRYSWLVRYEIQPTSMSYGASNWYGIPASYTWTSYGVAYPTQVWSDL